MSAISLKSISGITSITTPSGVNDVFTVHSNDTNERFRVDQHGNVNIVGVVTASSFSGITTEIKVSDESTQTLTFPLFVNASVMSGTVQTANLEPKAGSNLYFNSATGQLTATTFSGNVSGGNVTVANDLTVNGDVTLGDTLASDEVAFNSKVNTNLLPSTNGNKNLGSSGNRWGEVHAATFHGSGANLTGVTQSDRPVGSSSASTTFYEIDNEVTISTDTTLTRASSNAGLMYTKFQEVVVADTKSLIVSAGETLIVDLYQLS